MRIIVGYSEIGLKSDQVERKLLGWLQNRIGDKLDHVGIDNEVYMEQGRLFTDVAEDDVAETVEALRFVPGIQFLAPCVMTGLDRDDIATEALSILKGQKATSFAVSARRAGEHDYTSKDIEEHVGQAIVDGKDWEVDLDDPDITVFIEARYGNAFLYTERLDGIGGTVIDRNDIVVVPLRDRIDVYAGHLLMKRGCNVIPVYNGSNPDEVAEGERILKEHYPEIKLVTTRMEDWKAAVNQVAEAYDARAIGIGLTAQEIEDFDDSPFVRPVLKPTCGMSEDEILDRYGDLLVPDF